MKYKTGEYTLTGDAMVRNRLRKIRQQLHIEQASEFAKIIDVTPRQICLWESQQQQPSLEKLIKLWKKLRYMIPDLNLQDMVEHEDF